MKIIKETQFETSLIKEDVGGILQAIVEAFNEGKVDIQSKGECHTLIPRDTMHFSLSALHKENDLEEEESLNIIIKWKVPKEEIK